MDDVMGIIRLPLALIEKMGDRVMYYQIDPNTNELDFAAIFEVANTLE